MKTSRVTGENCFFQLCLKILNILQDSKELLGPNPREQENPDM